MRMGVTRHRPRKPKQHRNISTGRMIGRAWMTTRDRILERDNHLCTAHLEGCEVDAVEVHHIVPIELGGTNADGNLTSLCACCHYRYTTEQRQARAARVNAEKKEAQRRNHPGRKDRHDPV